MISVAKVIYSFQTAKLFIRNLCKFAIQLQNYIENVRQNIKISKKLCNLAIQLQNYIDDFVPIHSTLYKDKVQKNHPGGHAFGVIV